jgi:dTDP-glucose 4,6-dehydratase
VVITNCSNNYGPNQFPEKLIPLSINNIKKNNPIPIYGKGENIRDWLFVGDHAEAIDRVFHYGKCGETYNIGGNNEWMNIELIRLLCEIMDDRLDRAPGTSAGLIEFVKDRAGHDLRYAIDAGKIKDELAWEPTVTFREGLAITVDWYLANQQWLDNVLSGDYANYYDQQYKQR